MLHGGPSLIPSIFLLLPCLCPRYGSDIAVNALVNTNIFKAAAVASSSLDPFDCTINSAKRDKNLNDIGFAYPGEDAGRESWKKISLTLNVDRDSEKLQSIGSGASHCQQEENCVDRNFPRKDLVRLSLINSHNA